MHDFLQYCEFHYNFIINNKNYRVLLDSSSDQAHKYLIIIKFQSYSHHPSAPGARVVQKILERRFPFA